MKIDNWKGDERESGCKRERREEQRGREKERERERERVTNRPLTETYLIKLHSSHSDSQTFLTALSIATHTLRHSNLL